MIRLAIAQVMPAARATGLFVSLASFQRPTGDVDELGEQIVGDAGFEPVPELQEIPCMSAPLSISDITAAQMRNPSEFESDEWRHVLLDDWYPTVNGGARGLEVPAGGAWRVIIDGQAFTISGVEDDSQRTQTRFRARITTI